MLWGGLMRKAEARSLWQLSTAAGGAADREYT